jgi:hypothetical protein
MQKLIIAILLIVAGAQSLLSQTWVPQGNDTIGCMAIPEVKSILCEGDSFFLGGPYLYAGSSCLKVNGISCYANGNYKRVGFGVINGAGVEGMVRYKGKLYASGGFGEAAASVDDWLGIPNTACLIRWNNTANTWESVPNSYGELNSPVRDLTIFNDWLIIAGRFGFYLDSLNNIAAYDGIDYINIGRMPSEARTVEVYNGELYAGGHFFTLKKYLGGTVWTDVGGYTNYYIQDMSVDTFNNFLYITGGFTVVDNNLYTDNVAIWNGHYWESVGYGNGAGSDGNVVAVYQGDVYAGLAWDSIGGVYTGSLARWDGQNWHAIGNLNNWIEALVVYRDTLYVGGSFTTVNGVPQKAFARYVAPLTSCNYLKPRAFAIADTFYLNNGTAEAQFYNNNAYAHSWQWDFGDGGTDNLKDPLHAYTDTGTYTATVTVTHDSCVKTAEKTVVVLLSTGVEELSRESLQFKLYPNPTSGDVTVECTLPANKCGELRMHNTYGSLLESYAVEAGYNKIRLPASRWTTGISLVSLMIEGRQVLMEKVVKQ